MRELKRQEYLEKIVKSENKRDFQSSDHANAIGGDGTVAKYYENVDIREVIGSTAGGSESSSTNQYEILLDGKPLKSPKRAQFILPNKLLACAIATEWATQEDDLIRPFTMPLMQLSSTALDNMSD
jgi:archaellum component FlaF (FlaF/FlaG flagellin family)